MEVDEAGPGPGSAALQRRDGRTENQMRTLLVERSLLARADGSARWAQGDTAVLASVFGPRQAPARKEDAERAVVEVALRPRAGQPGPLERSQEVAVRRVVEGVLLAALHPRTSVQVLLQVTGQAGSLLPCALNAACAALVDAAMPLRAQFAAAACALSEEGLLLIDPDQAEEQEAQAVVHAVFTTRVEDAGASSPVVAEAVLASGLTGAARDTDYLAALDRCRAGAQRVAAFAHLSLQKTFRTRT